MSICREPGPWAPGYCPPEGYQYPEYIQPVQQTVTDSSSFVGLPPSLILWLLAILVFVYIWIRIRQVNAQIEQWANEAEERTHNADRTV